MRVDRSLCDAQAGIQAGIRIIAEAAALPPGEAIRFVFDHYRTSSPDAQGSLVLALIAEVATLRERQATTRGRTVGEARS